MQNPVAAKVWKSILAAGHQAKHRKRPGGLGG